MESNQSISKKMYCGFFSFLFGIKNDLLILNNNPNLFLEEKYSLLELVRRKLLKARNISILFLSLIVIIFIAFYIKIVLFSFQVERINNVFMILFVPFCFFLFDICKISENFEEYTKQIILASNQRSELLNNIVGEEGKISWCDIQFKEEIEKIKNRCLEKFGDFSEEYDGVVEEPFIPSIYNYETDILFDIYRKKDDDFFGIYNNVKFRASECISDSKDYKYFYGVIIKVLCNFDTDFKAVIKKPNLFHESEWALSLVNKLKKIPKLKVFKDSSIKIYSDNALLLSKVLTPNFIDLVNKLGSKYTFVFAKGDLYILLCTSRDKFKFGALNKSIDDVSQFALFKQDIKEVLNIVNKVKNIEYLSCPTEDDWKLFE